MEGRLIVDVMWAVRVAQRVDEDMMIVGSRMEGCFESLERSFKQMVKRVNQYQDEEIVYEPLEFEEGFRGAQILIERNTDVSAIFCSNDLTAIGAMRALQTNGIHIPKDISLISIDDIDTVQYLSPMLTTVHVPTQEMGQMAAKILIDRIEGGHRLPVKISLPFYLANRESCTSYRRPGRLQKRSE